MSHNPLIPAASGKTMTTGALPSGGPLEDEGHSAMSARVDAAIPWMASATFHLGLLLLGIFALMLYAQKKADSGREAIVIPSSFEDPQQGVPHPGIADPMVDMRQNITKVLRADGFAQVESKNNVVDLLQGKTGDSEAMLITTGTGARVGAGPSGPGAGDSGVPAPYGSPGGGDGLGPKSNFFIHDHGKKIVYILDHSGSMLDNFDFLRQEAVKSVNNMIQPQQFDVVMVSEVAEAVFPGLRHATRDAKRDFDAAIQKFRAQGRNDDLLDPFKMAFEKAFSLKPDLIYFLTDGHFDPRLTKIVSQLNRDHKVHVNTLAFIDEEKSYAVQLQDMARSNGGTYKFVSEADLGK